MLPLALCGLLLASGCVSPRTDKAAENAYAQSIDLLSKGKQIEAEDVVNLALADDAGDEKLLFAKGVLRRSRWSKFEAMYYFSQLVHSLPDTVSAKAASLSMLLDQNVDNETKFTELVQLSDEHPDDIYLLWLSALQSREQAQKKGVSLKAKKKMAEMGRTQYEKLLSRVDIGPVMAHHTYANILTEYLEDYDEAMKHRQIAVSIANTSWVWQGMANTLREMGRYEESSDAWEKCLAMDPDDGKSWRLWGGTLYNMKAYAEALKRYEKAASLDPNDAYNYYRIGKCKQKLKQYDGMRDAFKRGADLNYSSAIYELGRCYAKGWGGDTNLQEAVRWYRAGANQGDMNCLMSLAVCYEKGVGAGQSFEKAKECYQKALTVRPADMILRKKIKQMAVAQCGDSDELIKAAESGNAIAQRKLGYQYQWGDKAFRNLEKAVRWYRAAAEQNDVQGLWRLARCYADGQGTPVDEFAALECFERALRLSPDDPNVWFSFASFLAECDSEEIRDGKRALELAEKALADRENITTLNVLSRVYAANGLYEDAFRTATQLVEFWGKEHPDQNVPSMFTQRLKEYEKMAAQE